MPDANPQNGLIVIDEHFIDLTYLAANDGGATNSDYSEADPRPGQVVAVDGQTGVPVITNAQDQAVTVTVQRSGYAGQAGLAYALADGTRRGWQGVVPIGFESIQYVTSQDYEVWASAVIPGSQKIVVVYGETGSGSVFSRTREADSETWGEFATVTTNATNAVGLVVVTLPGGAYRLVMVRCGVANRISSYFSDDEGASWEVLARAEDVGVTLAFTPTQAGFTAALVGDNQILAFALDSGGSSVQLASPDQGITWSRIATITEALLAWSLARAGDGSAVLVWQAALAVVYVKRFPSAFVPFGSAPSYATGSSGDSAQASITVDADDTIYVLVRDTVTTQALQLQSSVDGGVTWSSPTVILDMQDGNTTALTNIDILAAAGRLWLFHQSTTGVSTVDGSRTAVKLASWSSHEWDGAPDVTWLPIEFPDSTGWTASGTATVTLVQGRLRLVTSANTRHYTWDGAGHSFTPCLHLILSAIADATGSTDAAGAQVTATSASETYALRVLLWDDTLQFRDNIAASSIVEIPLDGTTDVEVMIWFVGAAAGRAMYKRPTDIVWTEVPEVEAHTFSDGGALESNCWARFGILSAASLSAEYRFAAFYEDFGGTRDSNALIGKKIAGTPYPVPELVDDQGRMAHLSLRGGLAVNGESYTLPEQHTYQLEHVFPGLYPSPTEREWRSEDTSEQIIAFSFGGRAWLGGALAVIFDRVNFEIAHLEYHDGSAWQTLASYNGAIGFAGLSYQRTGGSIYPSGTADSTRMLQEMELAAGGWARFNDGLGGSDVLRSVCGNTGGWWTDEAGVTPVVNLDGITGSEPAGGTCYLVSPGGVLVAYMTTPIIRQRWRIRIPAQDTVEGYFRAGLIGVGRVMPFARPWSWGARQEERGQFASFRDFAGNERRSKTGEITRSWMLNHSDGQLMTEPRQVLATRAIGVSGGLNLEPFDTVLFQQRGVLKRTRGQTVPVCAVAKLPSSTTTITDRTLFLWGYPTNSLATAIAQGTEGVDEVVRVEDMRIDGFPGG